MSVYGLSGTVVPHLVQANSRLTQLSPPQAIACGPHVCQGIHYYSLIMIIGPQLGSPSVVLVLNTCGESRSSALGVGRSRSQKTFFGMPRLSQNRFSQKDL